MTTDPFGYKSIEVESDADMEQIYGNNGSALYLITEPKKLLTKFKQLKEGESVTSSPDIYNLLPENFAGADWRIVLHVVAISPLALRHNLV